MAEPVVCTSVARARLAEARLLARDVARHVGARLVVLVADDPVDGATHDVVTIPARVALARSEAHAEPFERLSPADLGIEARAVHQLALCREGDDLAACLVPALVRLLGRRGRPVVALAPDVVVLGPLGDLVELAGSAPGGVALVPRLLGPVPLDDLDPSGLVLAASGAFDPGVVAVAPGDLAAPFLAGWAAALAGLAASGADALSTRQSFLDFAPDSFRAASLRHPGYGVAAWNAQERRLEWSEDAGYRAGGQALELVHLEGFDPRTPELLQREPGLRPRVVLSAYPALRRLCVARATGLSRAPEEPEAGPWPARRRSDEPVRLADGTLLEPRMRALARRAVATGEALPDPFEPGEVEAFHDWLASPDATDPLAPTLPRYLREIYGERRDLQWHFPRLGTVDMAHFREWVASHGLDEAGAPPAVRAALARTPWWTAPTGVLVAEPGTLRTGVVLAGYLRAESGVGEAARLVFDAMVAARIDVAPVVLGSTPSRQGHPFLPGRSAPPVPVADRNVNLVWTSPEQLPGFASVVGPEFFAGRFNIGFWAWETDRLPARLAVHARLLDEVWVPSAYVRDAVEPAVERPVRVFPHPIVAPPVDPSFVPARLGIPKGFFFLFSYDFLSSFTRKNPLGVLAAFSAAFRPGEGPVLVLKSVNGSLRPAEREQLLLAASGRPDVIVVDRYLAPEERGALVAACGCFVSLHRAEGFGLGLGEAMALARPVIATAYSGNLEFMDEHTALLVPAEQAPVGPGAEPYDATDTWADPDLDVAAALMRKVVEDARGSAELGRRARDAVLARHGTTPAERFVARRLGEIEKMLRKGYASGSADAVRAML